MIDFTETCQIITGASTTTQSCYSPTDIYSGFFIEFLIVALTIGIVIFLIKQNKLKK